MTPTDPDLGQMFDGMVVPEATPSPRTIRFATPPLHAGPSRSYDSAAAEVADARVTRIFGDFREVTNVLVGPDFVAVTISAPDRWQFLLGPLLRVITEEFTGNDGGGPSQPEPAATISLRAGMDPEERSVRGLRRLERAWVDLGALRADRPEDLERILAATRDADPAHRQVAAALLADAPPEVSALAWEHLLADPSRVVRRSVVDAIASTGREQLRPLLEEALTDSDSWTRWKALQGIGPLGVEPSRTAVEACAADPDFRVRLEATRLLTNDP